jgi:hypothetical protein
VILSTRRLIVRARRPGVVGRRSVVVAALALVVTAFSGSIPVASIGPVDRQVLTIGEVGDLSPEVEATITSAAERFGARWATFHRGTLRLVSVERDEETIQEAPRGYFIPMATTAVDAGRAAPLLGEEVAPVLRGGGLVFGETSARLRGAAAGDRVTLVGWDGRTHQFDIGAVVADELIGWAELALDLESAARIGFERPSFVAVWDYGAEDELLLAMWSQLPDALLTVDAYFDPDDPDAVLPTVLVKERFGEFAYRPTGGDRIILDPDWRRANIVDVDLPYLGPFRCHKEIVPVLEAALEEMKAEGLAWMIDYRDFQIAGGCYNARLIRGGDKGGAVSRHAWGIAIDINPGDNPYGGPVGMDERIGEIFRKSGFAWGAGWRFPDGGHFEWTHEPEFVIAD